MGVERIRASVVTVSDGVSAGVRRDDSGDLVEQILQSEGFDVTRTVVADEVDQIIEAIKSAVTSSQLVLTTGGTGFGPRDVTPEATAQVIEREAPGLIHAMVASGLTKTPMAALSRARAGSVGSTLVVNLPGSPKGATENLQAVMPVIPHIIQLLSGDTEHR